MVADVMDITALFIKVAILITFGASSQAEFGDGKGHKPVLIGL